MEPRTLIEHLCKRVSSHTQRHAPLQWMTGSAKAQIRPRECYDTAIGNTHGIRFKCCGSTTAFTEAKLCLGKYTRMDPVRSIALSLNRNRSADSIPIPADVIEQKGDTCSHRYGYCLGHWFWC
jgi:hypothetical protein